MFYTVSILSKSTHPQQPEREWLWEEAFYVVEALDEITARQEAERLARLGETTYPTVDGSVVQWKFIQVGQVFRVEDTPIQHGSEVFSRFLKESEVQSLLSRFE